MERKLQVEILGRWFYVESEGKTEPELTNDPQKALSAIAIPALAIKYNKLKFRCWMPTELNEFLQAAAESALSLVKKKYAPGREIEIDELYDKIGPVQITWIGSENLNFIAADGNEYFCKCL